MNTKNLGRAEEHFAALQQRRAEIEKARGAPLTWHNPENKKMCRIYTRTDADFLNSRLWPQQHEWLRINLEKFQKVFGPIIVG